MEFLGTAAVKKQSSLNKKIFHCHPTRFPARIVEPLVWDDVVRVLSNEELAGKLIEKAQSAHKKNAYIADSDKLRQKICGVEEQLEALVEHLSKIPKAVSPAPIFAQMERLGSIRDQLQKDLVKITSSGDYTDAPASLCDYQTYLKTICTVLHEVALPEEKNALIKALVHKIELFPDRICIHYVVGESQISIRTERFEESNGQRKDAKTTKIKGGNNVGGESQLLSDHGSKRELTNGEGGSRTPDLWVMNPPL